MTSEDSARDAGVAANGSATKPSTFSGGGNARHRAAALVSLLCAAVLLAAAPAPCAAGGKASASRLGRGRAKVAAPRLLGRRKAQRGLKAARGALGERYRQKRQARRQAFGRQALRSVGALPAVGLPGPPRPDAAGGEMIRNGNGLR